MINDSKNKTRAATSGENVHHVQHAGGRLLGLLLSGHRIKGSVQKREKGEEEEGEGESERAEEAKRAKESDRGERKARVTQRV